MRRHRFHIFALLTAPLLFVALVGATRMNPIYSAILSLMSGGIATCYCRPDLMPKMAGSAFWFVGFYFAYLLTLVAIYPDYVRLVWNLPAISGVVVLGILSLLKIPSEGEFKQGEKLILNLHERAKRAALRSTNVRRVIEIEQARSRDRQTRCSGSRPTIGKQESRKNQAARRS